MFGAVMWFKAKGSIRRDSPAAQAIIVRADGIDILFSGIINRKF
jgi:hypothetical protein